jgi:hypothetical protein
MILFDEIERVLPHASKYVRMQLLNPVISGGRAWVKEGEWENLQRLLAAGGPPERKDLWLTVVSPSSRAPPRLASRAQTGAPRHWLGGRRKT